MRAIGRSDGWMDAGMGPAGMRLQLAAGLYYRFEELRRRWTEMDKASEQREMCYLRVRTPHRTPAAHCSLRTCPHRSSLGILPCLPLAYVHKRVCERLFHCNLFELTRPWLNFYACVCSCPQIRVFPFVYMCVLMCVCARALLPSLARPLALAPVESWRVGRAGGARRPAPDPAAGAALRPRERVGTGATRNTHVVFRSEGRSSYN